MRSALKRRLASVLAVCFSLKQIMLVDEGRGGNDVCVEDCRTHLGKGCDRNRPARHRKQVGNAARRNVMASTDLPFSDT